MNSIVAGRIVLLLVVIGLVVGGYRWYSQSHGGPGLSMPAIPGLSSIFGGGAGSSSNNGDILVLTTGTKKVWLQQEIDAFNDQNQGKYHAVLAPLLESRDGMHAILEGHAQPVVWSPSSPVWIARLGSAWAESNNGQSIVNLDSSDDYKVILTSPLVVLTTKHKAPFFKAIFSSGHPWSEIKELSMGGRQTPWGSFKFAHADPLDASSGMLTMSLILTDYASSTNQQADLDGVAKSDGFAQYLQGLDRKFVFDQSAIGSSALERAYSDDPGSRDFITAYESSAMQACEDDPTLAVVYPEPTAIADQSAAVLSAPWVTAHQQEGGRAFLAFLDSDQSLADAVKLHFRPVRVGASASLDSQIQALESAGFQQTYSHIDLPTYDAINDAAFTWRQRVEPHVSSKGQ
jgi:hypothetical protein